MIDGAIIMAVSIIQCIGDDDTGACNTTKCRISCSVLIEVGSSVDEGGMFWYRTHFRSAAAFRRDSYQVWDTVTSGLAGDAGEMNGAAMASRESRGGGAPLSPLLLPPHGSSRRFLRRLCETDMQEALQWLQEGPEQAHHCSSGAVHDTESPHISSRRPLAFLCGPPAFADGCAAHLAACGLSPEEIIYERWW